MSMFELFEKQVANHGRDHSIVLLLDNWKAGLLSDPADYAKAIRLAWEMTDNCSFFFDQWNFFWDKADPNLVMTDAEREKLAELPDELTLYRGYCARGGAEMGLAWSPDRELAEWFSKYHTVEPTIAELTGHKSDLVYVLMNARDGWEAIVLDEWATD